MNAVEFVKECGIERVVELLSECPSNMDYIGKCGFSIYKWDNFVCKKDLKQIIDAFELVEKSGGLKACRKTLKIMDDINADKNVLIYKPFSEAVNLVEQCQ